MNKIEFGGNRQTMRRWAEEGVKVQTCVTSPPYYGLRDYGTGIWVGGDPECSHKRDSKHSDKTITGHANTDLVVGDAIYKSTCPKCGAVREDLQLGLEETPEEYIATMVDVFRHVKNILADDGTLWLNIGDSYVHSQPGRNRNGTGGQIVRGDLYRSKVNNEGTSEVGKKLLEAGYKSKDLIGIPWMLAFALRADGWYLRQDIIWHKPNPMPESVQDRCTKSHEYIFLMSKSQKYYYDNEAIKEKAIHAGEQSSFNSPKKAMRNVEGKVSTGNEHPDALPVEISELKNKRSVWTVNPKPYAGAHFAVFPSDLIEPCILAGAPTGGIVLDPFMGSGTTAQVAQNLGRQYMGCELNLSYKELQDQRLAQESFVFE